ncbi:MAG: 3-oxocholest-4-en-26-oate---CoA ligase [Actinomycetota bacterium]|nr:3-oxocholest-4-en-26-oate---CoA ligase [Actinomycetota bacterium]
MLVAGPTFNLADLWETLCDAGPDAECLVAPPVRHTRGSLDEAANRVANHLISTGVQPGDRVGIYSRNRAEYVEALFGCWKCGAVPVNINWRYVAAELRYVIEDAELVTVIVEGEYLPVLDEVGFERRIRIGEWAQASTERAFGAVSRSADDVYMLYTGGTTGMPKGVMWRHEDFFYACCMGGSPLEPISEPGEITRNAAPAFRMSPLVLGPLMHGGGQWLTLIALFGGNRAVIYTDRHFDAGRVLDLAVAERATTIGIIGDAMARPLAEAALAEPDRWAGSEIIGLGNGGAMLSSSVKSQLAQAFPNAVLNDSYGASETGAAGSEVGASTELDRPRFSTDGRTWVLDPDTLEPLEPGSGVEGLFARKGHIPLGYWKDPAKTAATFRTDAHGVRWVVPGDWATIDAEGRIVLFGRGSGCINSGGEKIFPEEVEAVVRAHDDVFDAVVVGVPDDRFGQKVVALVKLRAGAPELTLDALQDHCRTKIAGYKVPRELLVGEAPRTNTNKPDYATALQIALDRLGS